MIGPAVSFGSSVNNVPYNTNASDRVACVDAIKGNFNTLEYSLAKHISYVPTKLNGVEFTDENAESWGVSHPHTPR